MLLINLVAKNGARVERIKTVRDWAQATRRILPVDLPLEVALPMLSPATGISLHT